MPHRSDDNAFSPVNRKLAGGFGTGGSSQVKYRERETPGPELGKDEQENPVSQKAVHGREYVVGKIV